MVQHQTTTTKIALMLCNTSLRSVLAEKHTKHLRSVQEHAAECLPASFDVAAANSLRVAALHACAVYGGVLPFYLSVRGGLKLHALYSGLEGEDDASIAGQVLVWADALPHHLISYDWYCRKGHPCWMLLYSEPDQTLVLSIRGTVSTGDILTDACGSSQPFGDGIGHSGMVEAAKSISSAVMEDIEGFMRQRPAASLLVTGHSLGGGVATLVALILRASERFTHTRLSCVALAPPPVLDAAQAARCCDFVTSVVFGADVPRLSVHSLEGLVNEIHRIDKSLDATTMPDPDQSSGLDPIPFVEAPLFIAGRVVWLHELDGVQYSSSPDRELFGHLLFDPNMVAHHTPFPYGIAIQRLYRAVAGIDP